MDRDLIARTFWFSPQSIIQLANLLLLLGLAGTFMLSIRILPKFNKALDIWLSKNKEEKSDL